MNLALMILKKNKTKIKPTIVTASWLNSIEDVNLVNLVKLKRCLRDNVVDLNFDINEDLKVDANDLNAWVDCMLGISIPARFSGGTT